MDAVLLIPAAVAQSHLSAELPRSVPSGVLTALGQVADPHRQHGVRHGCTAVLAIAVCAVLAGTRSYVGIGCGTAAAHMTGLPYLCGTSGRPRSRRCASTGPRTRRHRQVPGPPGRDSDWTQGRRKTTGPAGCRSVGQLRHPAGDTLDLGSR